MKPENKNPYEINDAQQAVPVGDNYKGYTQHNNPELSNLDTFLQNWYEHRDDQIYDYFMSPNLKTHHWMLPGINLPEQKWYEPHEVYINRIKKTVSKQDMVQGGKNYISDRLSNLEEYLLSDGIKDPKVRPHLVNKYKNSVRHSKDEPITDDDLRLLKYIFSGTKLPDTNIIIYSTPYSRDNTTKIHERAHGIDANNPFIPSFGVPSGVKLKLRPGIKDDWFYWDRIDEIKSRLMELRFNNKLDPTHKYNIFEIRNMRKDPKFKDSRIFERYNDETILDLLNKVAQNTNNPYSDPNRARV